MSMDALLVALDKARETTITADLAVLSLTAATFMATLRTECSQNLRHSEIELRARSGDYQVNPTEKAAEALGESKAGYEKQKKLVKASTEATRVLLWAFILFLFNLVDKLWLDPVSKELINSEIGSTLSIVASEITLPVDVLLLGGAPALGVILLVWGANRIFAVVGTDKSEKIEKSIVSKLLSRMRRAKRAS